MNEVSIFNGEAMGQMLKASDMLSKSSIIPQAYQNNPGNCFIAVQTAEAIKMNPLMVMQNLNIIHGKTSWSGTYCAAVIERKFGAIEYEFNVAGKTKIGQNEIENKTCRVLAGGKKGAIVSIEMAVREGWWGKTGSKWPTMTEQMLMYRAASFFARLYCSADMMGLPTTDEVIDAADPIETPHTVIEPEKQKQEPKKPKKQPEPVVDVPGVSDDTRSKLEGLFND